MFLSGYSTTFSKQRNALNIIRSADDQICTLMVERLQILIDKYDDVVFEKGDVLFTSDSDLENYNKLSNKIAEVAERQAKAQQKLLQ